LPGTTVSDSSEPRARRRRQESLAAVSGIAAVSAGLGVAELIAAGVAATASPLLVVGSLVIDLVPGWLKDAVISLFGTADKIVLLISLGVLVALLAAIAGILEFLTPPLGRVLVVVVGLVGVVAAVTRANSAPLAAVPSLATIVVAVIIVTWLTRKLRAIPAVEVPTAHPTAPEASPGVGRRKFLILALATTGIGLVAAIGGRMLSAGASAATAARSLFRLPPPAVAATPIPAGASLNVAGISPLITPNAKFYRIDTALVVPNIDPATWSLKIIGMVDHPITLTFDELIALPLEESTTTLACVSNYVGGDLISNATWLGYPIRNLLARAAPQPGADMVLSRSIDGFTASTPLTALTDERNAILAIGMNGKPLPFEHGYPVRMVVPGLYGYVSATKWVTELKVTRFDKEVAYWTERGWSQLGPVKMSSRIDVPSQSATIKAGTVAVAGVAWSQHIGISRVQVRVDNGPWNDAQLGDAISNDTWRQWVWPWPATQGRHTLSVRATDTTGLVQTSAVADVVPDGATGLHSIQVTVQS
jgi:DMSO/TMAO reductase YedYZ molybdopterin-dependent catalytic subunit